MNSTEASLFLLTLNIEGRKHLDLVKPFLRQLQAEIICFQEIYEDSFVEIKTELRMEGHWVGSAQELSQTTPKGAAILCRYPIKSFEKTEFDNFHNLLPQQVGKHAYRPQLWLLTAKVEKEGQVYRVATTHFTWTPNGESNEEQRVNLQTLLQLTEGFSELVVVGDFNTPRGGEIFDTLAAHFQDNIPASVETTIDGARHRAGDLQLVVDGVFSRGYTVTDVQVHSGVSDHCGVSAVIQPVFSIYSSGVY